jgi:AcrR family transcriptional regulator
MVEQAAVRPTRADKREQSRELILKAAIDLFAERGFAGVSLDEIALSSGAKRSLILYYFKSKDELWRQAADEVARTFNGAVRRNLAKTRAKAEGEQQRALSAWLDAFLDYPDFPRFLVREGGMPGPRLQWLIERFEYSPMTFLSPTLKGVMRDTVMRDALMAIYLSMAALGPLMEASLAHVTGRPRAGVYPMSRKTRRELVALMMRFLSSVETGDPTDCTEEPGRP